MAETKYTKREFVKRLVNGDFDYNWVFVKNGEIELLGAFSIGLTKYKSVSIEALHGKPGISPSYRCKLGVKEGRIFLKAKAKREVEIHKKKIEKIKRRLEYELSTLTMTDTQHNDSNT